MGPDIQWVDICRISLHRKSHTTIRAGLVYLRLGSERALHSAGERGRAGQTEQALNRVYVS